MAPKTKTTAGDKSAPADDSTTTPTADATPEPTIEAEPELAEDVVVQESIGMETIRPVVTLNCRIGPDWYAFLKDVEQKVPSYLLPHLQRCGVI